MKTNKEIGIVDYGIGNIRSIIEAISEINHIPICSKDPEILLNCDCLFLPGVGAFKHAMDLLIENNLFDFLKNLHNYEITTIGVCLGMQMLSNKSYEFGETDGLSLIPGEVKSLNEINKNKNLRLPHVDGPNFISRITMKT